MFVAAGGGERRAQVAHSLTQRDIIISADSSVGDFRVPSRNQEVIVGSMRGRLRTDHNKL